MMYINAYSAVQYVYIHIYIYTYIYIYYTCMHSLSFIHLLIQMKSNEYVDMHVLPGTLGTVNPSGLPIPRLVDPRKSPKSLHISRESTSVLFHGNVFGNISQSTGCWTMSVLTASFIECSKIIRTLEQCFDNPPICRIVYPLAICNIAMETHHF